MLSDEIRLALPAEPNYGRIARIAAAGLALRAGFDHVEVQDLRIAVDEALILLLRPDGDGAECEIVEEDAPVTFTFTVEPDRVVVDAAIEPGHAGPAPDEHARSRFAEIVAATVDDFSVDDEGLHVHLEKRRATASTA